MYQAYRAYKDHAEWQVRSISPEKFRQLDELEVRTCFWTREAAVKHALVQNGFALRQAREQVSDLEAQIKELNGEPSSPPVQLCPK